MENDTTFNNELRLYESDSDDHESDSEDHESDKENFDLNKKTRKRKHDNSGRRRATRLTPWVGSTRCARRFIGRTTGRTNSARTYPSGQLAGS